MTATTLTWFECQLTRLPSSEYRSHVVQETEEYLLKRLKGLHRQNNSPPVRLIVVRPPMNSKTLLSEMFGMRESFSAPGKLGIMHKRDNQKVHDVIMSNTHTIHYVAREKSVY